MILDFAREAGLKPGKISSTKGGQYASACPVCGGKDRFTIWAGEGRYWCRQCKINGDSIQFCRDFLGMTFKEAKEKSGSLSACSFFDAPQQPRINSTPNFSRSWKESAQKFVDGSFERLFIDPISLDFIKNKYGILPDTLRRFLIGWNPIDQFPQKSGWGLKEADGKNWLCLPKGIVIPTLANDGSVSKIKIRRGNESEGKYAKYQEVEGSLQGLSIYGYLVNEIAVLVESEFDAMCVWQETKEAYSCVALGGATKRPDPDMIAWLRGRKLILYSLDNDDAGKAQYSFWRAMFPNLRPWLSETRKSPADSFVADKINLSNWIYAGIRHWSNK
jgi:DNA primase